MSDARATVLVLDDDSSVRTSLGRLLEANNLVARAYASGEELLAAGCPLPPACLLLDQHLLNEKGTDIHRHLKQIGWRLPTVFLTADWDTHTVVQAVQGGADNYLTKPYDPEELLRVVNLALQRSLELTAHDMEMSELRLSFAKLTPRERMIVSMVSRGMLNKQIADDLGLALVTVKLHRGRAMKKLGAQNTADLARIALQIGL